MSIPWPTTTLSDSSLDPWMRIAVISDTHGNLRALEAVLADIAERTPDAVVDLGDCVSGPLQPAATADLLMSREFLTIRGNHDRELAERPSADLGELDKYADAEIDHRHRAWLASFPATAVLGDIFLCHGTPASDLTYFLEQVGPCGASLAPIEQVKELAGAVSQPVILCGHTHFPRAVQIPDGPLVINPGSIGLPAFYDTAPYPHTIQSGSPHARYAIVEQRRARWSVDFITVEYDWTAAARDAAQAGNTGWAHTLATGYALPR